MAFLLNGAILYDMEYRGYESGVSTKTGKEWVTLKFEDKSARQVEVSVPANNRDKYPVGNFVKGQSYTLSVRAVAGRESSYVQLLEVWETGTAAMKAQNEEVGY